MISAWPQALVASFMVALVVVGFIEHGKPQTPKTTNRLDVLWRIFVLAAVLGAGGFWRIS